AADGHRDEAAQHEDDADGRAAAVVVADRAVVVDVAAARRRRQRDDVDADDDRKKTGAGDDDARGAREARGGGGLWGHRRAGLAVELELARRPDALADDAVVVVERELNVAGALAGGDPRLIVAGVTAIERDRAPRLDVHEDRRTGHRRRRVRHLRHRRRLRG